MGRRGWDRVCSEVAVVGSDTASGMLVEDRDRVVGVGLKARAHLYFLGVVGALNFCGPWQEAFPCDQRVDTGLGVSHLRLPCHESPTTQALPTRECLRCGRQR